MTDPLDRPHILAPEIAALRQIVGRMTNANLCVADHGDDYYSIDIAGADTTIGHMLNEADASGIVALRNTALPIIDALLAERDALYKQWHGALDLLEWANAHLAQLEVKLTYLADLADIVANRRLQND